MDSRRDFIRKSSLLAAGGGLLNVLPESIAKAFAINPAAGSTFLDAEHVVFLMQENRSFDHTYGSLQGVRGFNDPRAIDLPNRNPVWLQSTREGNTYAPFRLDIKNTKATWMDSLPHSWSNQVDARNNGKYDQWLESKRSGVKEYDHMPLTLGYYTREDIPFYYSLADAFTVCDQHFCSSLTGTTPNRLFFWTGTIREKPEEDSLANVWNEDADYDTMVNWTSFPERLEKNNISWKIYQNEIGAGVGFEGEEDAWLSNFGDNPLEYFTQYNVKLSAAYISNLPKNETKLIAAIERTTKEIEAGLINGEEAEKLKKDLEWLNGQLKTNREEQKIYTLEKYERLSAFEKSLHEKAFATNSGDPLYHQLDFIEYAGNGAEQKVAVPKGDILHQFRKDVHSGSLPTVSWLVAPQNFSDHPSSAWYGAWYISEVMDILTSNPEVWKKTIFVLTYDENDGYFDHVPPFVAPHPHKAGTGLCSKGIDTSVEYVSSVSQQSIKDHARESPIGLGYRVPMVIVSPWSRGGWVCSEVFDHTSSLRFLEQFLSHKTGKKIREENISDWRRTVCGDLVSAFRPYNGEKVEKPIVLDRNTFVKSIHQAQFTKEPANFKQLSPEEIRAVTANPKGTSILATQEEGYRSSCALPYELYVDGRLSSDRKNFEIKFATGKHVFPMSAGSPFQVFAPGMFNGENVRTWDYAVKSGDSLTDRWKVADFENRNYHLRVYGPNGFYREFKGNSEEKNIEVGVGYERGNTKNTFSGNVLLRLKSNLSGPVDIQIIDNAYQQKVKRLSLKGVSNKKATVQEIIVDTKSSNNWYDFTVRVNDDKRFDKRYAGRVETGKPGITDPAMGTRKV